MTFATQSRVKLTDAALKHSPDMAGMIGTVRACGERWIEVDWKTFRSTHKIVDLEPAEGKHDGV